VARKDGQDTGCRWGGVNGARQWSEAARRWSATARRASAVVEWGRGDGARRSQSEREIRHCNHVQWIRAHKTTHVVDVRGRAQATSACA
jgi:hypothetical protein